MAYVTAGGTAEGPRGQDRCPVPPTTVPSTDPSTALTVGHLKLIKSRFFEQFLEAPGPTQAQLLAALPQHRQTLLSVQSMADAQKPDGSWPDLDYAAPSQDGGPLPSMPHLYRLLSMARAYRSEASPQYQSEVLAGKISAAISFWIKANPLARHQWWYDRIGVPLTLGEVLVLFEDRLTREQLQGALPILKRANQNGSLLHDSSAMCTGENLIWQAMIQVLAGAIEGDARYVATFARRAEQEIALDTPEGVKRSRTIRDPSSLSLDTPEGIQPDYSFHQHGPLVYSGGYGQGFARDCADLAFVFRGTPLAFSSTTVELLGRYVLDGQRWMIRGGQWDFGVVGRSLAYPGRNAQGLTRVCDQMKDLWPGRAAEFEAMARGLRGQSSSGVVEGNRMFWRSDFMAHQRPGFHASARMCSTRIKSNESGNGENVLGYHLGHGATCLMRTGEEYRDLMPFWDWQMLPGVTCARSDQPLPQNVWGKGAFQESSFAGGVSDGRYGVDPSGTVIPTSTTVYAPDRFWSDGVGIVTPHRAQQALVVARLQAACPATQHAAIRSAVDTVERFQGQQRDVIIATFALGDPDAIGDEDEFLLSLNRFNVMASRARAKLIVFVSQEVVDHLSSDMDVLRGSALLKSFVSSHCTMHRQMTLGYVRNGDSIAVPGTHRWHS